MWMDRTVSERKSTLASSTDVVSDKPSSPQHSTLGLWVSTPFCQTQGPTAQVVEQARPKNSRVGVRRRWKQVKRRMRREHEGMSHRKKRHSTEGSNVVTHRSTNSARRGLTSVI